MSNPHPQKSRTERLDGGPSKDLKIGESGLHGGLVIGKWLASGFPRQGCFPGHFTRDQGVNVAPCPLSQARSAADTALS